MGLLIVFKRFILKLWNSEIFRTAIAVVTGLAWTVSVAAQPLSFKFTADDGNSNDYFGHSVSMDGDYAIVGAYGDDDKGSSSGSAYIFKRDGTSWSQQRKVTAGDGNSNDYFGHAVSIDGDYAIVGAYRDDDNGSSSGSAYIFARSGTSWNMQDKLTLSIYEATGNDNFGYSVSIDGDYALVGAPGHNAAPVPAKRISDSNVANSPVYGPTSGAAVLFRWGPSPAPESIGQATSWELTDKFFAYDGEASDQFGYSVAIGGGGAIVGAKYDDDGSAYLFQPVTIPQSSLHLGTRALGRSVIDSIKIINTGFYTVTIDAIAVISDGNSDSTHFSAWPANLSLAEGDSGYVYVAFAPSSTGAKSATLALAHDAMGSPSFVTITGTGTVPGIDVSTGVPFLSLGAVPVGSSSVDLVKVKNPGTADLSVTAIDVSGTDPDDFVVTPGTLTVAAGDSAYINVAFSPSSTGAKSATLSLTHDAPGSPSVLYLTGTGTAPQVVLSPYALSFGTVPQGSSSVKYVTVRNEGDVELVVSAISVSGTDASLFAFSPSTLTVAAGDSGYIGVDFAPSSTGAKSANLSLVHNGAGSPSVVALTGTCTAPLAALSSTSLSLGAVPLGSSSSEYLTIKNNGGFPLLVSAISLSGYNAPLFTVSPSALTVGAGDSGYVRIEFTPVSTGTRSATLSLTHDAAGSPAVVAVTGTGTAPQVIISTLGFSFGTVPVGLSSIDSLKVKNRGLSQMVVSAVSVSGGDAALFSVRPSDFTIAAGDSAYVYVEFSPVLAGDFNTTLSLTHFAAGSLLDVSLAGSATATWQLLNARPNPFNQSTVVGYEIQEQTHVTLTVYNLLGQEVVRLIDQVQLAGRYEAVWNGVNSRGAGVASGIYLYRIVSGSGYTDTKRMTLLK